LDTLQENVRLYDVGKIQQLITDEATHKHKFCSGSDDKLVEAVIKKITSDENYKFGSIQKIPSSNEQISEVLQRYEQFISSEKEKKKRRFRTDLSVNFEWTAESLEKFKQAHQKFGPGPKRNKQIAEFIGNGVHPNHVAFLKQQLKKQKITNTETNEKTETNDTTVESCDKQSE